MGPSKVLTIFPLQIQSSWQLSLLELPPCHNTVTPFSDSSDMYTSTVQLGPLCGNAAFLPHPRLQTSYPPSSASPPSLSPGCPSGPPASYDRRACVVFLNHESRSFQVRRGVLQGSVLGLVLFPLFINDLLASLPSVSCSLCADDLAIWSSSPSVPTAVEATRGALF